MRIILISIIKYLCAPMLSMLAFIMGIGGISQAADLPTVIDKTNCSQYKDILIPSMYRGIERGDFFITTGNINFKYRHTDDFHAASAKNKGKYDLSADGYLIDKSTGNYPEDLYGFPFPDIDLKDPNAGIKIIYNFEGQRNRFMGAKERMHILWVNKVKDERFMTGIDYRLYLVGRPPSQKIINPEKVLNYEFQRALEPMSMRGTNTMSYIYWDKTEDKSFAYVPAIRRIRKTGSTTRSDPYMGGDSWLDMNFLWSGKTPSMTWKYVGEKTVLLPFTSLNILPVQDLPDGSITKSYPYTGTHIKLGYEDPKWKGTSWAPQNITYVPRRVWIVEQRPKDPYYNWGLHINYIDQETYVIWCKEVYEKSGEYRSWHTNYMHYSESPSGKNTVGDWDFKVALDEKIRHASIQSRFADPESSTYLPAKTLNPTFFTVNNFLMLSK